ncbi:MAG: hypothetical protein J6B13_01580 [Muribaculaceae bacterium]|nr:hypothetical protein [Muribaculaceae bacterium]
MNPNIQFQIECLTAELAEMLMEEFGWDIRHALDELYKSQTFACVIDPRCGLYYQGAVYVYEFLRNEILTGRVG